MHLLDIKLNYNNTSHYSSTLMQQTEFSSELVTRFVRWTLKLLFALSVTAHSQLLPALAYLNVTDQLWLHPVLFIAEQLKCEGSQQEDKYTGQQSAGVSQTKARSPSLSQLSSELKGKSQTSQYYIKPCLHRFRFLYFLQSYLTVGWKCQLYLHF